MKEIKVGLIGFGTVGTGVVKILQKNSKLIENRSSQPTRLFLPFMEMRSSGRLINVGWMLTLRVRSEEAFPSSVRSRRDWSRIVSNQSSGFSMGHRTMSFQR